VNCRLVVGQTISRCTFLCLVDVFVYRHSFKLLILAKKSQSHIYNKQIAVEEVNQKK
jgi:hypothetical protein